MAEHKVDGKSILLVEDNPHYNELLKIYLQKEGFQVTQSYDGRSALNLALSHHPDYVIIDFSLPDMNGAEVINQMQKGLKITTKYMVISGHDENQLKKKAPFSKNVYFIQKPVSPKKLIINLLQL